MKPYRRLAQMAHRGHTAKSLDTISMLSTPDITYTCPAYRAQEQKKIDTCKSSLPGARVGHHSDNQILGSQVSAAQYSASFR